MSIIYKIAILDLINFESGILLGEAMNTKKSKNNLCAFVLLMLFMHLAKAGESKDFAGITFIKIEPGCFQMGQNKKFKESSEAELPNHRVCIDKPFYLGETEVTQKQWEELMGSNPSKSKGLYKPVERVSWDDVQVFIKKLNEREGGNSYRLPTEAEWEYAARAGSSSVYSFGDNEKDLSDYAWYGNLGYGGSSREVGHKKPNQWGLYDMHGNVWEWVQDWYGAAYYSNSPVNDPKGPESGQYRVYRGGSWVGKAVNLRSSVRFSGLPVSRTNDIGFRLLKEF
jgi:formylglycine-generating enzyme required for sulfatase activity